jgi:hypothetical protein
MIDRTYGHLAPDAAAVELALLNTYDSREVAPERTHDDGRASYPRES